MKEDDPRPSPDSLDVLWETIEGRLGVCPAFFRLAHDPEVAWGLWRQAEFAYLDSPIPSLLKERLFVVLSQYCVVPYCLTRHCAFLLGVGHPAGDADAPATSVDDVLDLLDTPADPGRALAEAVTALDAAPPDVPWPEPGTAAERSLFACAEATFLNASGHRSATRALQRALGSSRYQWLALLLAFIRTAHFWTETHPELEIEADAQALLDENDELARRVGSATGRGGALVRRERAELDAARGRLHAVEEAQEEAEYSEKRLQFVLEVAELGQWDLDLIRHTALRSLRHDQIFGYEALLPEWTYEMFLDHVVPEDRSAVDAAFQHAQAYGNDWEYECRIRRADGAIRWISTRGRIWRTPEGDPSRMLGIVGDITDRKRAEADLRGVSVRLVQAGEDERRGVARDLHDELGGLLTSLQMSLRLNPAKTPEARAALDESETLVKTMIRRVREISLDLRPSLLDDLGLGPALDQLTGRFATRTGVDVDLRCELEAGDRVDPEVETTAYRVVQEALTNVARHAGVDQVQVLCHLEPSRLVVHIVDEGRGFEENGAVTSTGLSAMRERAALVGGTCEVTSDPGTGTRVTATLPVS